MSLQATTERHGYVYEMRRATYAWFNRWFEMKDVDDDETSQAVEPDATLFVTPTGFVTTSFGGETALSLTRQMAAGDPHAGVARRRRRAVTDSQRARRRGVARRAAGGARPRHDQKPGYRAEQFEFTSDREIRTPGWLLTPDNAGPSTPTVLYVGEAAAWSSVAEDAFAERLCAKGGCRVAVIDVRGRGDCAIAYPPRGRFYFPGRIPDEAYLTWFTLMLGKPLLGGQVYDTLHALDYLRSRPDVGGAVSLVGDGPHGVIALYAAALDERVRGVALRQTVTDYRSLAVAERYTQPFGIYAYGILREFDLPDVAARCRTASGAAAQSRDAAWRAGRRDGDGISTRAFRTPPFGPWTPARIPCRFWRPGRWPGDPSAVIRTSDQGWREAVYAKTSTRSAAVRVAATEAIRGAHTPWRVPWRKS